MKKVLYPILAVIVFLIIQGAAGVVIAVIALINDPQVFKQMQAGDPNAFMDSMGDSALAWATIISGLISIGIIALLKMIDWKHVLNLKMIDWGWGVVSIIAAIFGIFALNILGEMLDLPNLMEEQFTNMSNDLVGALSIAIIGPIIEEFIFREGVEGYMLRNGVNKWVAIISSGIVFGIIHLNPAQVPFAAGMGIIFGIIYYKSGNIILTSILHILNNSIAVWQMYSMGEELKDFKLVDYLGGTVDAIFYIIGGLGLCILWLHVVWKRYRKPAVYPIAETAETPTYTELNNQ